MDPKIHRDQTVHKYNNLYEDPKNEWFIGNKYVPKADLTEHWTSEFNLHLSLSFLVFYLGLFCSNYISRVYICTSMFCSSLCAFSLEKCCKYGSLPYFSFPLLQQVEAKEIRKKLIYSIHTGVGWGDTSF